MSDVFEAAGVDIVFAGHVHNYQRFSAPLHGKNKVPFIVAGAGGYNKRLHALGKVFQDAKQKKTRERRIRRTVEELEEGQRRPCCWPGCKHREHTEAP